MTAQLVDIGTVADDGTGDTLREAFIKLNGNMELDYIDSSDGAPYGQLVGLVNGSNTSFTVSQGGYISGTLEYIYNGVWYRATEVSAAAGTFTAPFAPSTSKECIAKYKKLLV